MTNDDLGGGEFPAYRWEVVPADTPREVLEALGRPDADQTTPGAGPVRVVRQGMRVPWPHRGD